MTGCLLCKGQIEEKSSFLQLFLLKGEEPRCCSICYQNFECISEERCPRCFRNGKSDLCIDCKKWEGEGNQVQHQSLFTYNEAMKNYFSQYKFQGDYALRFVFAKATTSFFNSAVNSFLNSMFIFSFNSITSPIFIYSNIF